MDFKKIASLVAKKEGKKSSVSIGNVREVLSKLIEADVEFILDNGPAIESPLDFLKTKAHEKLDKKPSKKAGK